MQATTKTNLKYDPHQDVLNGIVFNLSQNVREQLVWKSRSWNKSADCEERLSSKQVWQESPIPCSRGFIKEAMQVIPQSVSEEFL